MPFKSEVFTWTRRLKPDSSRHARTPDKSQLLYTTSLGKDQIRILCLLPGRWEDRIKCSLKIVSSEDSPEYEALSYAWGDLTNTESIIVDGVEIHITTNLAAALRHLRQPDTIFEIWVDAVCINQTNEKEKSQQVAMMGEIYRNCSQVQIWLGYPATPSDQGDDPFALLRHYLLDGHLWELPGFYGNEQQGVVFFEDNPRFQQIWSGFSQIAKSTWWNRLWVVQEAGEYKS
jgi:hypothetical protein